MRIMCTSTTLISLRCVLAFCPSQVIVVSLQLMLAHTHTGKQSNYQFVILSRMCGQLHQVGLSRGEIRE